MKLNDYEVSNAFEEAIALAGGPTALGKMVGLTYQRVAQIRDEDHGKIGKAALAERIQGVTGVPAAELCQFVDWRGPERHPHGNGRDRPSRRRAASSSGSSRSGTLHAAPAPAMAVGWR